MEKINPIYHSFWFSCHHIKIYILFEKRFMDIKILKFWVHNPHHHVLQFNSSLYYLIIFILYYVINKLLYLQPNYITRITKEFGVSVMWHSLVSFPCSIFFHLHLSFHTVCSFFSLCRWILSSMSNHVILQISFKDSKQITIRRMCSVILRKNSTLLCKLI